jgi:hypothetical protein
LNGTKPPDESACQRSRQRSLTESDFANPHWASLRRFEIPSGRSTQNELTNVEIATAKSGFAIREVKLPHAAERFIESERGDALWLPRERVTPQMQCPCITGAEQHSILDAQIRVIAHDRGNGLF